MSLRKRMAAFLMSMLMVLTVLPVNAFAAQTDPTADGTVTDDTDTVSRDIVLVLDNSVSMEGNPIVCLKKAATKFCNSVLDTDGTNRVAIVAYDTDIYYVCDFSDDLNILSAAIEEMDGEGKWTNITAGVQKADELLQASTADIKNIVVMTDGVPTAGSYTSEGPYTYNDYSAKHNAAHYVYQYANALYATMAGLLEQYNVYTLGFFHNTSENAKTFGARLLNDIQNMGYYEVTDPEELEFTFGEVADNMTQDQLRELYVNQHISYYTTDYETEVMEISVPDEDSYNRKNTDYLMGNIVLDAASDNVSTNYNVASIVTDALNLNLDFVDGAVSNYEFILADIVTSSYYKDILTEAYRVDTMDNIKSILQELVELGFNKIDTMAKNANVSADTLYQEWQALTQTLDQMKVCDDPEEFAALFGKCSVVVDKYVKADEQRELLNKINGKKGFRGEAISGTIGALTGAAIDTASEVMTYYSCYDAYCTASETFKEILTLIRAQAASVVQNGADGTVTYFGGVDEVVYCTSLTIAIDNFLENASEEATGAEAIASKFAQEGLGNLGSSFAEAGIDILLNHIPIAKELNAIRKAAGAAAAGVMFIVDAATEINDRAYAASMLYHLYFLANCTAEASDLAGTFLVNAPDSEKAFDWAYRFDESVRIWRCCMLMMCDLGVEFETYCLQSAQKNLRPWSNSAMEDASWHSTAITIAALQRSVYSDIHCHDVNLSYDPSTGIVDWHQNAQIVTIACPVTVYVTDENNNTIAVLADDNQTIAAGYEPYFHVVETEYGNKDYMKICCIPDTWSVTFAGTGDGTMHVLKADITDGKIQNAIESPEITVYEGLEGYVSNTDEEDFVVINQDNTGTDDDDSNVDSNNGNDDNDSSQNDSDKTDSGDNGDVNSSTEDSINPDSTEEKDYVESGRNADNENDSNTDSSSSMEEVPDTADKTIILPWVAALIISVVGVGAIVGLKRKNS